MHVLVINDDGPPSNQSSPYIHAFVHHLQSAGHLVSVVLPHEQRSWIGKAHLVGQITKPTYFRPGTLHHDDGTTHSLPSSGGAGQEEWVLVDGTPATCAQLGLFHFFQNRPPVDLVVSGPNYGRNSTSVFSLSSGTIGGAMEAAACQKRAIALSFAFFSRDHDPEIIADACKHSVRLIEHLSRNWGQDVDLYSINVPVQKVTGERTIMVTSCLQNHWTSGSSFEEVDPDSESEQIHQDSETHEQEIRTTAGSNAQAIPDQDTNTEEPGHRHRYFKWAPKFADIQKSVDQSAPGNDGWAIRQGYTSVTPLVANFMRPSSVPLGELKLLASIDANAPESIYIILDADVYTRPLILRALEGQCRAHNLQPSYISSSSSLPQPSSRLLQIMPYEFLNFDQHISHPHSSLANAYIIRKSLIRKHHLHNTITHWLVKNPKDQIIDLGHHVPLTVTFELDYAEFLDEALAECFELHESFAHNQECRADGRHEDWWILKPSLSDQGHGIRLFSSYDDLLSIFEEWEAEESSEASSAEASPSPDEVHLANAESEAAGTMTSQLRHFIAQRYLHPPLTLSVAASDDHWPSGHKFHVRSYVLAVGALQVYVWREMLALFARSPYTVPSASGIAQGATAMTAATMVRGGHLTNTCLQTSLGHDEDEDKASQSYIHALLDLPLDHEAILAQICRITATLFLSAATTQSTHFQPLPNSFEIFGLDFIIDEKATVFLLEVNAFPDFKQTGDRLMERVVGGLWSATLDIVLGGSYTDVPRRRHGDRAGDTWRWGEESVDEDRGKEQGDKANMVKVLEVDLGRTRW